jgi:hypothetical protein
VRASTQVLPGKRPVAAQVVVDGELAAPDLCVGTLGGIGRPGTLESDQLELVRLVGELLARIVVVDGAA